MRFSRKTFYKLNLVANKLFGINIMTSSVGRELHRYRRGHRFKYRTGLNLVMFIAANIDLMFTRLVLYFLTEEGSSRGVIVLILRR